MFHSTHWGSFRGEADPSGLRVRPRPADPDPSPLLATVPSAVDHPARVRRPAVPRGWWEGGQPGPGGTRAALRGRKDGGGSPLRSEAPRRA
ncbi:hypothetical protein [Pseudonocardia xishanensis]|uniref:hypothetical protein n=1 Tax=Pseudonocardia xishanensis TaxID=630995 RepID=UPI003CD06D3B